jgi:methanogenic corrinoid protein MtbC1
MEEFNLDLVKGDLLSGLLSIDRSAVKKILTSRYDSIHPFQIIDLVVVPILEVIGNGWENGDYSLSQVYMAGRLCEEFVDVIIPPSDISRIIQPKIAIVTLKDYHLLGGRIVYSTLRASGYELVYYGNMEVDCLADRVIKEKIKILMISVLMLPSALKVKELCSIFKQSKFPVQIVVGGAPFRYDQELFHEVGANAYGKTATDAIGVVKKMIEESS